MKYIKYAEGVFLSKWLSKFINQHLDNNVSFEKILYYNFFFFKKKINFSCLFYFFELLEKIKPSIGLKMYKIGGKRKIIKTIPFFLHGGLQYKKALYWLSLSIKLRKEKTVLTKLYNEFYNILINRTGDSFKKKKEYYKYTILFKAVKRFKW